MNIKSVILACLIALTCLGASAQTDPQFTQYWAVPAYYNPAAAGTTDNVNIRGGARLQWLGITHAPKSFFGAADSPLKLFGRKVGVGLNVTSESLGLFSNLALNAQFAFKFRLGKGEFSVAVQPGYFNQKFKGTEVDISGGNDDYHDSNDEAIPTQDLTGNAFDLGAGLYYTHKWFYVGVSGQHLLQPTIKLATEGTSASDEGSQYETELGRMLYFTAGSNIPIKNTLFEIQPSLLAKTDFSTFTAEVTVRTTYNKFLMAGIGYRWKDAISVMVGAEFKNIFVGYSYDYPLSAIAKGSSGSHEIMAGYRLKLDFSGKNKNRHRSIRLM